MNGFILKKRYQNFYYHHNICKIYSYCYILDLIYHSFQELIFLFQLFSQTHKCRLIFDAVSPQCQLVLLIICLKTNIQILSL